ncbi:hypothetical protein PR048_003191 [Dryococelus australis]|uniref:Uncharacterized protein n=1 Tax=Dryococelus australis TaxID=614101 RepID=A0ABQ9IMC5_9NEOP|nr:hypothetical protein PR048_003191 [Dryococelus australis]
MDADGHPRWDSVTSARQRPIEDAILLGLKKWFIPQMLHNPEPVVNAQFLRAHKATLRVIENAIGILKEKIPCLNHLRVERFSLSNIQLSCNFDLQDGMVPCVEDKDVDGNNDSSHYLHANRAILKALQSVENSVYSPVTWRAWIIATVLRKGRQCKTRRNGKEVSSRPPDLGANPKGSFPRGVNFRWRLLPGTLILQACVLPPVRLQPIAGPPATTALSPTPSDPSPLFLSSCVVRLQQSDVIEHTIRRMGGRPG